MAAYLVERARVLSGEGKQVEAVLLLAEAHLLRDRADGLTGRNLPRKLVNMPQEHTEAPRRVGRPTKSRHPFPVALEARGSNLAAWAKENGVSRTVAQSWFASKPDGRSIPKRHAKAIEKALGVPATETVWPNGIRE